MSDEPVRFSDEWIGSKYEKWYQESHDDYDEGMDDDDED